MRLVEARQRHEAIEAEVRRRHDARLALAERMREWFAGPELERLYPGARQPQDSVLGERVGLPLTGELVNKGSTGMAYGRHKYFGRIVKIEPKPQFGVTLAVAGIDARGISAAGLTKACATLEGQTVAQMQDLGGNRCGTVIEAQRDGSLMTVRLMVSDEVAQKKLSHKVYGGVLAEFDDRERLLRIGLVDSDSLAKGGAQDFGKMYDRKVMMKAKKLARKAAKLSRETGQSYDYCLKALTEPVTPALPYPVEKALQQRQLAENEYRASPSAITKAAFEQADFAVRKATIATSRPIPLIDFLRHGRP